MRKSPYLIVLASILFAGILAACGAPATEAPLPATETALPTALPTETATLAPPPTETVPPVTPTPEFAPICEPGAAALPTPSGCQIPIAQQVSTFCTNKVPYNLLHINESASYEVLDVGVTCFEEGIRDGKKLVTCTGPIAYPFELNVCDPACAPPTVQAETTQCPQDFTFDSQRGCCSQGALPVSQGCVQLNLQIRTCVINCVEIGKKSECEKNSYACFWDESADECQLRQ